MSDSDPSQRHVLYSAEQVNVQRRSSFFMGLHRLRSRQFALLAFWFLVGQQCSATLSEVCALKVRVVARRVLWSANFSCALLLLRHALRGRKCQLPRTLWCIYTVVCLLMRSSPTVTGLVCIMFLEYDYDKWLCGVLLFELDTSIGGGFVCGSHAEQRECVPR